MNYVGLMMKKREDDEGERHDKIRPAKGGIG
jgi:hypothetical protein